MSESEWWGWDGLPSLGLAGLMHIGEQGWKDMRWGGLCVVIIIIMIIIIITRPSALTTMKNSQRVLKSLCFYLFQKVRGWWVVVGCFKPITMNNVRSCLI